MSLETFNFVGNLVASNPAGTDPKSQGDDHLRGVKLTLQNQFGTATDGSISVPGQIESKATGIKFPDATVQASAALTAFIGGNQSLATNGYQKLPGGLILQWGQMINDNGQFSGGSLVTFPIPFPNALLHLSVEAYAGQVANGAGFVSARVPFGSTTNSYAIVAWYGANNALAPDQNAGQWFAIGH